MPPATMTDKDRVLTRGFRLLPLALVAAVAAFALAFAGDAGAERPRIITPPSIGTNPVVGQPLGVNMGSFYCDPGCFAFTVEFLRCSPGSNTAGCVTVQRESSNAIYTPVEDDIGFSIAAIVRAWNYDCDITGTDCRNSAQEVLTSATAAVKEDAPPVPVKIATSELADAVAGVRYSQTLSVSSGKPPFTWALVGGSLPPGLSFSTSGLISGTPTLAGDYTFTVRATGARRQTDTKQLTLRVLLRLSPATLPNPIAGTPYRQQVSVLAGGTPPYQWRLAGGVLPDGLTFANGIFAGTPARAGQSTVAVEITDARGATGSYMWTLTVTWTAVTVSPASHLTARVGAPYRQILTAIGGRPPHRFLLVSDCALPAGLTLSPRGVIAGTPKAAPGFYRFEVIVHDADGTPGPRATPKTGSEPYIQEYSLRLNPGPKTRAARLPQAAVGERYYWEMTACGGHAPLAFTVTSGRLPPGMTLEEHSGKLTGTARQRGTFRFTIRASDFCSESDSAYAVTCPIRVQPGRTLSERSYALVVRAKRR